MQVVYERKKVWGPLCLRPSLHKATQVPDMRRFGYQGDYHHSYGGFYTGTRCQHFVKLITKANASLPRPEGEVGRSHFVNILSQFVCSMLVEMLVNDATSCDFSSHVQLRPKKGKIKIILLLFLCI